MTQATPTYFLTTFREIFLKKFLKNLKILNIHISYYFIEVHVKNLAKNVIFKKIEIHLQFLLLFKSKCYNVWWMFLLIFYSLN